MPPQDQRGPLVTKVEENGLRRTFRIVIPGSQIMALRDARIREIAATVALPGFRTGQAPQDLVLQRYGAAVLGEVIEKEVEEASALVLRDCGLNPAHPPKVTVVPFAEGGDLEFGMSFEALPEIRLPGIPRLSLHRLRAEPGEEEMTAALRGIAARHGTLEVVAPRPAAAGDILVCDFEGRLPVDLLRNGVAHGARPGAPGLAPTKWAIDSSEGLMHEIRATGVEAGTPFFDLRLRGTAKPGGHLRIFLAPANELSVAPGQVLTLCLRARLTDGALPDGAQLRLGFNERSEHGLLRASRAAVEFGSAELRAPLAIGQNPAVAYARPLFEVSFRDAGDVAMTLRIGPGRVFPGAEEPEGSRFGEGSATDRELVVGGEDPAPGFGAQLEGLVPGERREIEVIFPRDHRLSELAGLRARYRVAAKELKRRTTGALDDALARALGERDLASLRAAVRRRLQCDYEAMSRLRLKREAFAALGAMVDFPVPETLVDAEFDRVWQRRLAEGAAGRADPADSGRDEDTLARDFRAIAARRVRLSLLLRELARAEGIAVTEEELAGAILKEASRYPGQEQQVLDYYRRNAQATEALRGPLIEEKLVDLLIARAEVTERVVTPAELLGAR